MYPVKYHSLERTDKKDFVTIGLGSDQSVTFVTLSCLLTSSGYSTRSAYNVPVVTHVAQQPSRIDGTSGNQLRIFVDRKKRTSLSGFRRFRFLNTERFVFFVKVAAKYLLKIEFVTVNNVADFTF